MSAMGLAIFGIIIFVKKTSSLLTKISGDKGIITMNVTLIAFIMGSALTVCLILIVDGVRINFRMTVFNIFF